MSILEVYNKYYQQEIIDEYESDENHMPYMVLIRDWKLREQFREELIILGYKCVAWNNSYPGVLVNIQLKRFGLINRACNHSCVDNRNYSYDEFCREILNMTNK